MWSELRLITEWVLMTGASLNLRVMKPSRKKPKPGDVFAAQLPDLSYLFGQVVSIEARWALGTGSGPANLVYIYRQRSGTLDLPGPDALNPDNLLVSPIMTNQRPWTMGYFMTLANQPLRGALARHCFWSSSRGIYFDEHGTQLSGPVEPVGDHGLHSFRTIDDQISDALGLPLAP